MLLPQSAIKDMLQMQANLNQQTNGDNWRSGVTALGKQIDWRRCIYMETAELIDSYPWKHWKSIDAEVDIENVRVELVDIWHFLLSLALEKFELSEAEALLLKAFEENENISTTLSLMEQIAVHETLMSMSMQREAVSESYITQLTDAFFSACQVADLSFESLYQIYMAKNVLNKFRQDNGYKEGSYIKDWNGKEDNVVMFEVIAQMSSFSGESLYESLKVRYEAVKN